MHIDADIHFWKFERTVLHPMVKEYKILREDFLPEQISLSLSRNGIEGCIAVSSEPAEVETRFLAELAASHPIIKAVVGWIDLFDERAIERIQEFYEYDPIRGYQIDADRFSAVRPEVMKLLRQYQYVLEFSHKIENSSMLADWISSNPDQYFVLKHSGDPDAKKTPSAKWEEGIRTLAKNKNLYCKISGLFTRGVIKSWKPADFYPFLDVLFDAFSVERLIYGSDWPFILVSGMYVQWKSLLEKFTEKYLEEEREKFFGINAQLLYRI